MPGKFSIEAVFGAIDHMSGPVSRMSSRLGSLKSHVGGLKTGVEGLQSSLAPAVDRLRGVALAAGAAATAVGALAVKTGMDFEKALSSVAAVAGGPGKAIDDLGEKAQKLGPQFGYTATQVVGAAESMIKSGYSLGETISGLSGILAAAAADGGELGEVSAGVMASMKGLGLNAAQMGGFVDMLAKAGDTTAASIGTLNESMAKFGPVARQFGVPLPSAIAQLALLQDAGLDASSAGTALASVYTSLAAPASEAQKQIARLGLTLKDAQGNLLPPQQLLGNLAKALDKVQGTAAKAEVIKDLVGRESQKALLNILADLPKLSAATEDLAKNSAGYAASVAKIKTDNFAGDLDRLKAAVESVQISVFNYAKGPLRAVVGGLGDWVAANKELVTGTAIHWFETGAGVAKAFASGMQKGAETVIGFGAAVNGATKPFASWDLFQVTRDAEKLGKVVVVGTVAFVAYKGVVILASAATVTYRGVMIASTVAVGLFNGVLVVARGAMWAYQVATQAGTIGMLALTVASKANAIGLGLQQVTAFAAAAGTTALGVASTAASVGMRVLGLAVNTALGPIGLAVMAIGLLITQLQQLLKMTEGAGGLSAGLGSFFSGGSFFKGLDEYQNKQARARAAAASNKQSDMTAPGDASKDGRLNDLLARQAEMTRALTQGVPPADRNGVRVEKSLTEMRDKVEILVRTDHGTEAEVTKPPARAKVRVDSSGAFTG